jgi:hypothetical protein
MEYVITALILAALGVLLVKHIRQLREKDPYGFDDRPQP